MYGVNAMKKFALAAIPLFAAAALVSTTPMDAKSGFSRGATGRAFISKPIFLRHASHPYPSHVFAHNRFLHRHHDHDHDRNLALGGLGWFGLGGLGWNGDGSLYAGPAIYQAGPPIDNSDVTGSIPVPAAQPVFNTVQQSERACSSEHVTVPSERGGETTVTVIRC
jgi:hypothetical protein